MDKIKLAAFIAFGIGAFWLVRKASAAAGQVVTTVADAAWAVSPTNNENVIYQTANWATGGTPDSSLGSRIYDWVHTEPADRTPPRDYTDPAKPLVNSDGYDFSLF
jgi:hypothetical protein